MKKRTLLIFLLAAVSTLTVASAGVIAGCSTNDDGTEQTTPVTYTVTFNSMGGSAVQSKTVDEGGKVAKPAAPTNDDATLEFGGWYTDQACTQAFDFNTPINANITLYAKWTTKSAQVEQYTVTFNSMGGSAVQSATVDEGGKVTKPTDPTNDDATLEFGGWYTDQACTQAFDFNTAINANITLYAKWNTKSVEVEQYTVTFNSMGGSAVQSATVDEGGKVTRPADPTNDDATLEFGGWYTDEACTQAYDFNTTVTSNFTLYAKWTTKSVQVEQYTVTFNSMGGSAVQSATVNEGGKVTKPTDPTNDDATLEFGGWYTDEACTQAYDFNTTVTSNFTLYAKWTTKSAEVEYEFVTTKLDAAAVAAAPVGSDGKFASDTTVGKFTFGQGTKPEDAGATINTQGKDITIVLGGKTNSISFTAEGGSSSGATDITLISVDGEGNETVVKALGSVANKVSGSFAYGTGEGEAMPAGTYIIRTSRSARVTLLTVVEELAKSEATGITVSGATTKFLAGRTFNSTGLNVTLNYANGRQDAITSGYTLDDRAVNMNAAGTYTVTVSYTLDGATTPFTASYQVEVYAADHLELSDYSLGTGRITLPVQKLFALNGTFNSDNLAVQAICIGADNKEEVFILDSTEFKVSSAELTSVGAKTVTVNAYGKVATYTVNVVDLSTASKVTVNVDVNGTVGVADGVLTVTSINDAIQAFKLMGTADGLIKTINVAAGTYEEKVEIDIPNVKLVGAGAETTTIVWDALAGMLDPSGSMVYSTDGSATVSVRESAEGFYAEGITFKNYYNTNALYQESLTLVEDTQAVACLVQADKSYFKNCNFTSYHDTLYAMTGRQVYENCYIEGRTDYIFGYNATCYFTGCTLKTLGANDAKNGGYIVATKGIDNGGDDVKYGYIFDNCTLTADDNVVAGTVSLARGWDVYMTVAFIECNISGAYSLEAYGDTTSVKNDRYTKMNAAPDATKLFEYGNTGDGALTADMIATADATTGVIANLCTVMTQAQATEYTTLATIFGATNGNMTYADAWDGTPVTTVAITVQVGEESAVIYGYKGAPIDQDALNAAAASLKPSGYTITGFAETSDGTAIDLDTYKLTADDTLYAVLEVVQAGTVTPESFLVSSLALADETENPAGVLRETTDLKITTSGDVKYDSSLSSKIPTINGTAVTAGYKDSGEAAAGTNTGTYTFEAKSSMTLTVYFTLCNNSYNSDRPATFHYQVTGGADTTVSAPKRDTMVAITVELNAGDTMTLYATNDHASSTAKLWFFGYDVAAPQA